MRREQGSAVRTAVGVPTPVARGRGTAQRYTHVRVYTHCTHTRIHARTGAFLRGRQRVQGCGKEQRPSFKDFMCGIKASPTVRRKAGLFVVA